MTDHDDASTPEYRALLAECSAPPADVRVDWDALHARIEAAAALPLARLRARAVAAGEPQWWEFAARRARALLPLAVAASLAMFAYARQHPVEIAEVASVDALDAYAAAVAGGASSARVTSLLVGSNGDSTAVMIAR